MFHIGGLGFGACILALDFNVPLMQTVGGDNYGYGDGAANWVPVHTGDLD